MDKTSISLTVTTICIAPIAILIIGLFLEYYVIPNYPEAKDLPLIGRIVLISLALRRTWLLIRLNWHRLVFLIVVLVAGLTGFNLAFGDWLRGGLVIWGVISLLIAARLVIGLRDGAEMLTRAEVQELRRLLEASIPDLQEVLFGSFCEHLGTGQSRIFHVPSPYVLPICFKNPRSSEYIYVVVGGNGNNEADCIVTEPNLTTRNISYVKLHHTCWYQLTSDKPLKSITFGNGPTVRDFESIQAEFHRIGRWNASGVITVPKNRLRAYALAITEQLGPSTWYVSIDNQEFTFDRSEGCHFVEFILKTGKECRLSLGYKEGAWGIACAFFAF